MKIRQIDIEQVIPYHRNPRKNEAAIEKVAASLDTFGWQQPIVVDADMIVVAGHTRLEAARRLGMEQVPVHVATDLSDTQAAAYRIADNRTGEDAEWDKELLALELGSLEAAGFSLEATGFELPELERILAPTTDDYRKQLEDWKYGDGKAGNMVKDFGVPPFTILDTRVGYWQDRKRAWNDLIGDTGESREQALSESMMLNSINSGVSILDAVMAELVVKWWGLPGGVAFDPFAGDSVFGFVSATCGMRFKGIELREEQAKLNQRRCDKARLDTVYHCDTAENLGAYIEDESVDLVFSCPPYADLEVYSDDPRDLSNMSHADFFDIYTGVLGQLYAKLKPNRFAVIVVGEVRGKDGSYLGLVPKTIEAMEDSGFDYYNEAILVNAFGTVPLRAGRVMQKSRKLGKVHQNVLVFLKGDAKEGVREMGDIDMTLVAEE